jgi:hypothetical protein
MEIRMITPQEWLEGNAMGRRRFSDKEATRIACALISTHIQHNWPDETIGEWMRIFHHTDVHSKNGIKVLKAINKILKQLQRKGTRVETT